MPNTVRQPYLSVMVDNVAVSNVISVRVSLGYSLRTSQAEVIVAQAPSWAHMWSIVSVSMGATQGTSTVRFTGYLVEFDNDLMPLQVRLVCRGYLESAVLTECSTVGGVDMSNGGVGVTDQSMVSTMLSNAGLTPSVVSQSIGGLGRALGTISTKFRWNEGESALAYIERLDKVCLGYRTYEGLGGTIFRTQITANPASTAALTFTEGVDIEKGNAAITVLQTKNRAEVTGFNPDNVAFSSVHEEDSPYVPVSSGYITIKISSDLLEADEAPASSGIACGEVANWQLGELNRELYKVTMTTPRDDAIAPGMTITVNSPNRLGLQTNMWVQSVDVGIDEHGAFSQTLVCVGGSTSVAPLVTPPLCDFAMTLEQETVVINGVETTLYIVMCVSSPIATSGTISSYSWTTVGGTPTSGTETTFTTAFTSLTNATVALQITDINGLTGTITKNVPAASGGSATYATRHIYLPGTGDIEDYTGNSWVVATESAALVVANGPLWGAGATVLSTINDLATAPTSSVPLAGVTVTAIWTETDVLASRVLVGLANGDVALSSDGGLTWTVITGPDGNPVVRVVINRFLTSQWFVLTAVALYRTDNSGAGWVVQQAAQSGETFTEFVSSFARGMIACAGGRLLIDRDNGTGQTFPSGLTPAIAEISAVTADIREDRFYAYDSTGRTFVTSAAGGTTMVQGATLPVGTGTVERRGMWRDGALRNLLYIALGSAGVFKSIDGFGTLAGYYQLRSPGVGTAPAGAIYPQVGVDGTLVQTKVTPKTIYSATYAVYLSLWNGTSNNAPPSGWQNVGFNDSAWPTVLTTNTPSPPVTGATDTTFAGGSQPNTLQWLCRQKFWVTGGQVSTVTLNANADDLVMNVWINNVWVGKGQPSYYNGSSDQFPILTVTVPPNAIVVGAPNVELNVIAVQIENLNPVGTGASPTGVSYSIAIS